MSVSTKIIKQYIHMKACRIHDAICLIYDFAPYEMILENHNSYREVQFKYPIIEFETLFKLLCTDPMWWRMRHNIFDYIEKSLNNNIKVSKKLIRAVWQYTENLTEKDYAHFQNCYPYLIKKFSFSKRIDTQENNTNISCKETLFFTPEERNVKYQVLSEQIWSTEKNLTKEEVAQKVFETLSLSGESLRYLIDKRTGKKVSVGTIERNFKKKR